MDNVSARMVSLAITASTMTTPVLNPTTSFVSDTAGVSEGNAHVIWDIVERTAVAKWMTRIVTRRTPLR